MMKPIKVRLHNLSKDSVGLIGISVNVALFTVFVTRGSVGVAGHGHGFTGDQESPLTAIMFAIM